MYKIRSRQEIVNGTEWDEDENEFSFGPWMGHTLYYFQNV